MLDIQSNGSKWAGQEPDEIDTLLDVLSKYPLRRSMLSCGDYIQEKPVWVQWDWSELDENTGRLVKVYLASETQPAPGTYCFSGNFYNRSHVFNIYTDEADVIEKLTKAIRDNQNRDDFLSQPEPAPFEPHYIQYKDGRKEYFTK